jgi:hypothetical protein
MMTAAQNSDWTFRPGRDPLASLPVSCQHPLRPPKQEPAYKRLRYYRVDRDELQYMQRQAGQAKA